MTDEPSAADQLRAEGAGRTVHLERDYPATAEQLWAAWTDHRLMARWLGVPAGPMVGATGPVRITMGEGEDDWVDARIVTADRPRLVELRWTVPGEQDTVLRVRLVPVTGQRTRVVLDHAGLTASSTGYGAGWQAHLEGGLAGLFGGETGPQSWDQRFAANLPRWRDRASAACGAPAVRR